jgi:TonB family protein
MERMRYLFPVKFRRQFLLSFALLVTALAGSNLYAQSPEQLSLADLIIALRSKKVTLPERNQILAGAVAERGITFALTPEIEKELMNTGADNGLIQAIKIKNPLKLPPPVDPKPVPVAAPPPPDAAFYRKRADSYIAKGEFDLAVVDLNRVFEMKSEDAGVYASRAAAYAGRNRYDLALGDLDKAVELEPKRAVNYFNRGVAHEKLGNNQKAIEDYSKALDLDTAYEAARTGLAKLQPTQAKAEQPKTAQPVPEQKTDAPAPPANTATNAPEFINIGQIGASSAKLTTPVYPVAMRQMKIQGKVIVQVTLDEEGKVLLAKATSGPSGLRAVSEEAVRRSKFSPPKVGDKAVKAMGYVIFNFVN